MNVKNLRKVLEQKYKFYLALIIALWTKKSGLRNKMGCGKNRSFCQLAQGRGVIGKIKVSKCSCNFSSSEKTVTFTGKSETSFLMKLKVDRPR